MSLPTKKARCKKRAVEVSPQVDALIRLALAEDVGTGDRTTLAAVPEDAMSRATVRAKSPLVLAGVPFFARVFALHDGRVEVSPVASEGAQLDVGDVAVRLEGPTRALLVAERTALNILQRLSGTATLTRRFVDAVAGTGVRIVDTRKTTPGMRVMEKHAVLVAGGSNHRLGLDSGLMIKDNHIAACGSLGAAVARVRAQAPHVLKVEVEVQNLEMLEEALDAKADVIMLDNMPLETMQQAVQRVRAGAWPVVLEASGNMDLDRIRAVAEVGVDVISVGALTHSAPSADLSMLLAS